MDGDSFTFARGRVLRMDAGNSGITLTVLNPQCVHLIMCEMVNRTLYAFYYSFLKHTEIENFCQKKKINVGRVVQS